MRNFAKVRLILNNWLNKSHIIYTQPLEIKETITLYANHYRWLLEHILIQR